MGNPIKGKNVYISVLNLLNNLCMNEFVYFGEFCNKFSLLLTMTLEPAWVNVFLKVLNCHTQMILSQNFYS